LKLSQPVLYQNRGLSLLLPFGCPSVSPLVVGMVRQELLLSLLALLFVMLLIIWAHVPPMLTKHTGDLNILEVRELLAQDFPIDTGKQYERVLWSSKTLFLRRNSRRAIPVIGGCWYFCRSLLDRRKFFYRVGMRTREGL